MHLVFLVLKPRIIPCTLEVTESHLPTPSHPFTAWYSEKRSHIPALQPTSWVIYTNTYTHGASIAASVKWI